MNNVLQASIEQLFYDLAVIKLTYSSVILYYRFISMSVQNSFWLSSVSAGNCSAASLHLHSTASVQECGKYICGTLLMMVYL